MRGLIKTAGRLQKFLLYDPQSKKQFYIVIFKLKVTRSEAQIPGFRKLLGLRPLGELERNIPHARELTPLEY